jgi:integrase
MHMEKAKPGRRGPRLGTRQRGYWYRKGRGWVATCGKTSVPLTHPDGRPIRDQRVSAAVVKEAYARFQTARAAEAAREAAQAKPPDGVVTVGEVCDAYLAHVAATGAKSSHYNRANTLFDFCNALPARFRSKNGAPVDLTPEKREAMRQERCPHPPYGGLLVARLSPSHVDAWLNSHVTWKHGRRSHIQALKRALNFAVERRLIPENPLSAYKVGKSRGRITYFTPEQEEAMLRYAAPALATALQVCIRTGLRYGAEFCKLEAKQIVDLGDRMEWRVIPKKTKTSKKFRLVLVKDPAILALTRAQMQKHPEGPIFRNESGNPWIADNLTVSCTRLRRRVTRREGIQFDPDACMNTCRHTFAKRTLEGYWTSKPTTIETLARLMGNTPQVCWDHYCQWSEAYIQPLWEAV